MALTPVLSDELRSQLLSLCQAALRGALTLEDLHDTLQPHVCTALVQYVYADIEDAVEHLPGHWLTGAPLLEEFMRSPEHFQLRLDVALLENGGGIPADVLAECHRALSAGRGVATVDLPSAVLQCIASHTRLSERAE